MSSSCPAPEVGIPCLQEPVVLGVLKQHLRRRYPLNNLQRVPVTGFLERLIHWIVIEGPAVSLEGRQPMQTTSTVLLQCVWPSVRSPSVRESSPAITRSTWVDLRTPTIFPWSTLFSRSPMVVLTRLLRSQRSS